MPDPHLLIVGGGLAGKETAKHLRRKRDDFKITLACAEPHLPYDRPPLSKAYLKGEVDRAKVTYETDAFYRDNNIELLPGCRVTRLDLDARRAELARGDAIPFDHLVLATGGTPLRLPVPGAELTGVHYLRSIDDADAIAADAKRGDPAVIVGGGFIGLEVAASLTEMGVAVTVVEQEPHIWSRFLDAALADYFQSYCGSKGVTFCCGRSVAELRGTERVEEVVLDDGRVLPCGLVCVGIGIRPNVQLAEAAGIAVDNGVTVDSQLRSSHPAVLAAGDTANYLDPGLKRQRRVEHWSHAAYCGRLIAGNLAGADDHYDFQSFVWSDIFDLALKFVGDTTGHDRILIRGDQDAASFSVLYLQRERVISCFGINPDMREFNVVKRLIQQGTDVTGRDADLADAGFDLKTL